MIEFPPTKQPTGPTFTRLPRPVEEQELHFLLEETREERDRSRIREALWISIIIHMSVLFALLFLPKWMPKKAVIVENQNELRDHNLTYLDVPHDRTPPAPPKPTNVISDKNRLQQSPHPDQKMLQKLLESRRQGAPNPPANQQTPQQQQQLAQQVPPQQNQENKNPAVNTPQETAQLQQPEERKTPDFRTEMSAGRNIEQAARNSVHSAGNMGDYGIGQSPHPGLQSGVDILSDTMGVDFGPYLKRVVHDVRVNWYSQIPTEALPPTLVKGKVAIQFAILKDGSVSGLQIVGPSGDRALDRAAQGGITGSNPFPPLPSEFGGQVLELRFYFYYNPKNPNELQ